jgi:ribosomal protein S18 acetylase RimI-like enzyme
MTVGDGELFRWHGETARLGAWRAGDQTAYLAPLGPGEPPSVAFIEACTGRLQELGYRSVVTSALLADQAPVFEMAGFSVHQHLHFLDHDLTSVPEVTVPSHRGRTGDRPAVAALDQRCFDGFWSLDVEGLSEIVEATPSSRFRVVTSDDIAGEARGRDPAARAIGYAISGRAEQRGYVQRLAVDPSVSGHGIGRSLIGDALGWMRRRGVTRAYVNTQVGNDTALNLYRRCGFRELPVGLRILARAL